MRIGIDACCWSNRRGFGRFTRELVTHLLALPSEHEFTLVVDQRSAEEWALPGRARLEVVATKEQPTRAASATGARSLKDLWRLGRVASRCGCQVFFFPAVYSFYPLPRRVPTVVAFHDAIAEQHPRLVLAGPRARFFWTAKTWLARRQADRILTVSESARRDVVLAFRVPEARVRVVPEAAGPAFRPIDDERGRLRVLERYRLPRDTPLLLCVGGLSPHKNLERLLLALARLDASAPAWHLALVGDTAADGFLACHPQLVAAAARAGLEERVTFTGFVPDSDLVVLYNAATMLVLPSLAEGFGLPALEAMACGLPVLASRRAALAELVGPAGLHFDPLDLQDMAGVIGRALRDAALRGRLRSAGLERARAFSWTAAAQATLRVLEEAASG